MGGGGGVVDEVCGRGEGSVRVGCIAVFVFEIVHSFLKLFAGDVHGERVTEMRCFDKRVDVAETAIWPCLIVCVRAAY